MRDLVTATQRYFSDVYSHGKFVAFVSQSKYLFYFLVLYASDNGDYGGGFG